MKYPILFLLLISSLCNSLNGQAYKGVLDLEGIITPILTELDKVVNTIELEDAVLASNGNSHENVWESKLRTADPGISNNPMIENIMLSVGDVKANATKHENVWESKLRTASPPITVHSEDLIINAKSIQATGDGSYTLQVEVLTTSGQTSTVDWIVSPNLAANELRLHVDVSATGESTQGQGNNRVTNSDLGDNTAKANNRNNGRSNDSKCCNDGIVATNDNQVIVFDRNTQWFSWEEPTTNTPRPNPIEYLAQSQNSWITILRDSEGTYLSTKMAYTDGEILILNNSDLEDGKYYIEIFDGQDFFRTAFNIGKSRKLPPGKVSVSALGKPVITAAQRKTSAGVLVNKTRQRIKEEGKVRSATNNNNGGRYLTRPCCDKNGGIVMPSGYDALGLDLNSTWRLISEQASIPIPNPIPYFNSINTSWTATLANENGQFIEEMQVSTAPDEMLISTTGLNDGVYIIELEHDGDKFRTNFTIGTGAPSSTAPSKKF